MNGAESLVRTLTAGGVEVCFTNPGTSEMHFVAALDRGLGMRCVLGLFEGVVTGAADGYARMADKPASTLLHLGPGLGNGLANLHNARRAFTPMVNIVGDHATYHRRYDSPLTADIEGIARPVSAWVRTTREAAEVGRDAAEAIAAARPGHIATLILPADSSWNPGGVPAQTPNWTPRETASDGAVAAAARALRSGEATVLFLGGRALRAGTLEIAGRIAARTGCRLLAPYASARIERGAGRVFIDRLPYDVTLAMKTLEGVRHLVLVGTEAPVAFFAYPNLPSVPYPADCALHAVSGPLEDAEDALLRLADAVDTARTEPRREALARPAVPQGALGFETIAATIAALLPEGAIVVDESITSGRGIFPTARGAPPHDWLQNLGGSIGLGLPMATGAAIACPDRKVLCLEGDGSAMYTLQALWTQAREGLDVTTVIFSNRAYAILRHEYARLDGGTPGQKARDMLDLVRPEIGWVDLARSMGVPGTRADDLESFVRALGAGLATPGPALIELVI